MGHPNYHPQQYGPAYGGQYRAPEAPQGYQQPQGGYPQQSYNYQQTYPQPDTQPAPNVVATPDRKGFWNVPRAIGAGVLGVVGAVAAANIIGYGVGKMEGDHLASGLTKGSETSASSGMGPGTGPNPEANPSSERIHKAAATINGQFDQARQDLNNYLRGEGQAPVSESAPSQMSQDMSMDDILTYDSVASYIAGQNPAEKDDILAGTVDPASTHWGEMTNIIQVPGVPVGATWEVQVSETNGRLESPVFHEGKVADYDANGTPSRVAIVRNKITGQVTEDIFTFKDGQWLDYRNLDPKTDLKDWVIDPEKMQAN